jgi:hypothetical protein
MTYYFGRLVCFDHEMPENTEIETNNILYSDKDKMAREFAKKELVNLLGEKDYCYFNDDITWGEYFKTHSMGCVKDIVDLFEKLNVNRGVYEYKFEIFELKFET